MPSRRRSLSQRLLAMLLPGPVEREKFTGLARCVYASVGHKERPDQEVEHLLAEGLIEVEVRLTEKGREKLGLKP